MARTNKTEPRPRVGVEIASDRVTAARVNANMMIDAVAARSLAPAVLTPFLASENVQDRGALVGALRDALDAVSGKSRDVTLVLPDACTRISLLDFDTLPDRTDEADGVVRFRLKKTLPFDLEHAAISYDVQRTTAGVRVVAAVVLKSVLEEYEEAVREAGFTPGLVLPSMAAALGAVDTSRPTLVVKFDRGTSSLAIANEDELLLLRTLELPPESTAEPAQIADDVYPSLVFFEDTYHMKVERIFVGGVAVQHLATTLEEATGLRAHELVPASYFLAASVGGVDRASMGGLVGALIG